MADETGSVFPSGGQVRPMTRWGEDVMHRPGRKVETFDAELAQLVADMAATMYAAQGVGLAACQIGVDLALFIFDCPDADNVPRQGIVCNPTLVLPEGEDRRLDDSDEGCLSYPGAFVACARPDRATVHGFDLTGEPITIHGSGLLARCLQHETDHTNGTVFGDRVPTKLRKQLQQQMEDAAATYPPGWPATTAH